MTLLKRSVLHRRLKTKTMQFNALRSALTFPRLPSPTRLPVPRVPRLPSPRTGDRMPDVPFGYPPGVPAPSQGGGGISWPWSDGGGSSTRRRYRRKGITAKQIKDFQKVGKVLTKLCKVPAPTRRKKTCR